jgi:hypothetical protein
MRGDRIAELLMLSAPVLFGQLDPNSITVTATRSAPVQPDQAVFSVTVSTDASATLDSVVAALQPAGITVSQFAGVATAPALASLQWNFTVPVPLSKIKDTVASFNALQQPPAGNGMSLDFSVTGTQTSAAQLASQPCSNAGLIADATTQAQKLTIAAGLTLGPILGLTTVPTPESATAGNFVAFLFDPAVRISGYLPAVNPAQTCSLTVKFAITR